jgi:hypothetical protein
MITERLMATGDFELDLLDSTPKTVLDELTHFGHLIVTPTWIAVDGLTASTILDASLYTGVIVGRSNRRTSLEGYGLPFWLGDPSGGTDVAEATVTTSADTFANRINTSVLTQTGDELNGITSGSLDAGVGTNDIVITAGDTRLDVLNTTCRVFDKDWRINPDGSLDADDTVTLFNVTPTVVLTPWWGGREPAVTGFRARVEVDEDVEDYTTRWVVKPVTGANGDDDIVTTYRDLQGELIIRERYSDESGKVADTTDASAVAARRLGAYDQPRQEVSVELVDAYCPRHDIEPGDNLYIYDPPLGLVGSTGVYYAGHCIHPIAVRVHSMTWPIRQGMGVYHRASDTAGTLTDLTPYVVFEDDPATLEVGAPTRALQVL